MTELLEIAIALNCQDTANFLSYSNIRKGDRKIGESEMCHLASYSP